MNKRDSRARLSEHSRSKQTPGLLKDAEVFSKLEKIACELERSVENLKKTIEEEKRDAERSAEAESSARGLDDE